MQKKKDRRGLHAMGLYSAVLSQLTGPVLIGIFGGRWLDERYQMEPLFLILCLLVGLAAGIFAAVRTINYYIDGES